MRNVSDVLKKVTGKLRLLKQRQLFYLYVACMNHPVSHLASTSGTITRTSLGIHASSLRRANYISFMLGI